MGQAEADAASDLAAKWDRAHEAAKQQESTWQLGAEMLKDPEDRRIPIQVGTRAFTARWPTDQVLRSVMALEAATEAMHTLTAEQWDELRQAYADQARDLLHDAGPRNEALLRGDYGVEYSRAIIRGVMDAYSKGQQAVATFRGQQPRTRAR